VWIDYFLSIFCFVTAVFYLFIGAYAILLNPKASANRIFLGIIFIFSVWAFSAFFININNTEFALLLWKLSSLLAWTFGSCAILHFAIALTKQKDTNRKAYRLFLLYIPGLILFAFQAVDIFYDILPGKAGFLFEIISSSLFYLIYISTACYWLFRWAGKSNYKREKIQSYYIVFTLGLTTASIFLYGTVLQMFVDFVLPYILPVFPIFWIVGMGIAITKYRLMEFKPDIAVYEVMDNVLNIIILADNRGKIIEANKQVEEKLRFEKMEIVGRPIEVLIQEEDKFHNQLQNFIGKPIRIQDEILLKTRNGQQLPVKLLLTPVYDQTKELMGIVFSAQDLTLEKKYQTLSVTDKLTQIYNRQKLDALLEKEADRAKRYHHELSVILLDIDHFKKVNDHYGHQTGDLVLVAFAKEISANTRRSDVVGRWGGEEFLIILPDTGIEKSEQAAEKLRTIIEKLEIEEAPRVTASFGVACLAGEKDSITHLLARADKALYKAKNNGRNRTEVEIVE